jgi:hypothetical protein
MNRKSIATIAIPTGVSLPPAAVLGVSRPMLVDIRNKATHRSNQATYRGTISMQQAMPMAPVINRNFLPKRSTVQVALRVKRIPQVAFKALIRFMVSVDGQIFL